MGGVARSGASLVINYGARAPNFRARINWIGNAEVAETNRGGQADRIFSLVNPSEPKNGRAEIRWAIGGGRDGQFTLHDASGPERPLSKGERDALLMHPRTDTMPGLREALNAYLQPPK